MAYLIVDMDGKTHARFEDATTLLKELDRIRADEPEMIDELAVLKYDSEGRRTGAPVSASSLIPKQAREVGAVLVESSRRGVGTVHSSGDHWTLQPAARVPEPA